MMDHPLATDAEAREYHDAASLANRAVEIARREGHPTTDLVASIFINRERLQATCLLITAARITTANQTAPEDKVLGLIERLIRLHCDRHQDRAELWEEVREIADKEADDAWEYAR